MFKGLFSQLVIIAVAVGIVLTYVQPTFAEISTLQDDIGIYREERKKVAFVNQQLQELLRQINQIPATDRQALLTYLPDPADIDVISIPRDLEYMTELAGAEFILANLAEEGGGNYQPDDPRLVPYAFNFSILGSYDEVKAVFVQMEQNHYPLEVHTLNVSTEDFGETLRVDMLLVTYAYQSPVK